GFVIGDAVEHGPRASVVFGRKKARQVDPGEHFSALRINASDAVGQPDVGVDLPFDVFEFVELSYIAPVVLNRNHALNLECVGVEESNPSGAVAPHQPTAVVPQPPALPPLPYI